MFKLFHFIFLLCLVDRFCSKYYYWRKKGDVVFSFQFSNSNPRSRVVFCTKPRTNIKPLVHNVQMLYFQNIKFTNWYDHYWTSESVVHCVISLFSQTDTNFMVNKSHMHDLPNIFRNRLICNVIHNSPYPNSLQPVKTVTKVLRCFWAWHKKLLRKNWNLKTKNWKLHHKTAISTFFPLVIYKLIRAHLIRLNIRDKKENSLSSVMAFRKSKLSQIPERNKRFSIWICQGMWKQE